MLLPTDSFPLSLAASVLHPVAILVLCLIAGIGTILLLPGRREAPIRTMGGLILLGVLIIFVALLVRQAGHWSGGEIYFWVFSAIALIGAIRVITHQRPVYSALYFVLAVVASAGLFVLMWAEFMAAALVLIYAGAILVTYVFVIMLAQQAGTAGTVDGGGAEYDITSREPVVACAIGFGLMGVLLFLIFDKAEGIEPAGRSAMTRPMLASASPATATVPVISSAPAEIGRIGPTIPPTPVQELGEYLFSTQVLTLEIAGLILTISMVGAIVIARTRAAAIGSEAPGLGGIGDMTMPGTPTDPDDNPHSIPVYGTKNPAAKAYPET
jgi:NADH-quinone oxidoreductase subunit J